MKSPFPGMDPYLERHWRDIHHRFLTYACDELQGYLPGDLRARFEERVFVEPEFGEARGIYPDIRIVEHPGRSSGPLLPQGVAVAEPVIVCSEREQATEGYIEIIDLGSGNRVVTVVELLSESNKLSREGQEQYRKKQRECLLGGVNLVEIDLLRSGKRVLAVPPPLIPPSHRTTYQICVTRGSRPHHHEVYRAPLAEPLPVIRVPLRSTDADVPLDLQALIGRCYHHGRYDDLDYQADPTPPLDPAEARWADQWLAACGLRCGSPHPPGAAESKS